MSEIQNKRNWSHFCSRVVAVNLNLFFHSSDYVYGKKNHLTISPPANLVVKTAIFSNTHTHFWFQKKKNCNFSLGTPLIIDSHRYRFVDGHKWKTTLSNGRLNGIIDSIVDFNEKDERLGVNKTHSVFDATVSSDNGENFSQQTNELLNIWSRHVKRLKNAIWGWMWLNRLKQSTIGRLKHKTSCNNKPFISSDLFISDDFRSSYPKWIYVVCTHTHIHRRSFCIRKSETFCEINTNN